MKSRHYTEFPLVRMAYPLEISVLKAEVKSSCEAEMSRRVKGRYWGIVNFPNLLAASIYPCSNSL